MSLAVCTISGTLYKLDGAAAANEVVRVRLAHASGEVGIRGAGSPVAGAAQTVYTDSSGVFSVTLPRGVKSYWEIPAAAIWGAFATVPSAASASFDSLGLYSEGY